MPAFSNANDQGQRPTMEELEGRDAFVKRHIGPTSRDLAKMLEVIGADSLDDLIDRTVPADIRLDEDLDLPSPVGQQAAQDELREMASANRQLISLIGMGYNDTVTPPVIRRNIMENPGWYTAYTQYQPEISQGRLEALLNFQTMVIELTGMEIANASLLDEGTAAAEAMTMLHRVDRGKHGNRFVVDSMCHPQTIAVITNRAAPVGLEVEVADPSTVDLDGVYGMIVQYPGTTGEIPDLASIIDRCNESQTLVAVAADPLALTTLTPPGTRGADIVVGPTQRFGVPMGCGGPPAAYFAPREQSQRALPGRLIGTRRTTRKSALPGASRGLRRAIGPFAGARVSSRASPRASPRTGPHASSGGSPSSRRAWSLARPVVTSIRTAGHLGVVPGVGADIFRCAIDCLGGLLAGAQRYAVPGVGTLRDGQENGRPKH